ncbi:helix-turn-helix domain-containing protein [Stenotrophomonas maltophilia]|uniref:helix-turn-helix domain-containing protein n=1 Tax=Stenotrophomonas maltophilia TaxID=40324 RepID=UPI0011B43924|nr:helix-turn-helix domain-containing protein [Stenotrophomonas maltophilia]
MDKSWASIIGELQSAGMTYAQIGEAIGAAGSTVGDLATGRSQSPRAASAFALLKLHSSRFLPVRAAEGTTIRPLVDSRMSKRALSAKLGMDSDKHLATLLQLPVEEVEAWPEEGVLPPLPQIQRLLGVEPQAAAEPAIEDPDANRIGPVDTA